MLQRLALEHLVAEGHLDALAAARRQRHDLVGRERALGQDREHLAPDIAGGADDRDLETHSVSPEAQSLNPAPERLFRYPATAAGSRSF